MGRRAGSVLGCLIVLSALRGPVATAAVSCLPLNGVFTIYVSNFGSDAAEGCTMGSALETLVEVNTRLNEDPPLGTVHIRIDPNSGTYFSASGVHWTYYSPYGFATYFLPYGVQPTDLMDERWTGIRPTFKASTHQGYWFSFKADPEPSTDVATNLYFMGLRIENFARGGILIEGAESGGIIKHVTNNHFHNLTFVEIGTKHQSGLMGLAAIGLDRSSDNDISYNSFWQLENIVRSGDPSNAPAHIHAVYLQHDSDGNEIFQNRINTVSGDPVRVRDASDSNRVLHNFFTNAGSKASMSDWLNTSEAEEPSFSNQFKYNDTDSKNGYGTKVIKWRCVNHYDDGTIVPPSINDGCWQDSSHRIATSRNDDYSWPDLGPNW